MHAVRNIVSALNNLVHARRPAGARAQRHGAPADRAFVAGRLRPSATVLRGLPDPAEDGPWARGGTEPGLEEMLRDPIVQLVIRADRLEPAEVRAVLDAARRSDPPVDPDGPQRPAPDRR